MDQLANRILEGNRNWLLLRDQCHGVHLLQSSFRSLDTDVFSHRLIVSINSLLIFGEDVSNRAKWKGTESRCSFFSSVKCSVKTFVCVWTIWPFPGQTSDLLNSAVALCGFLTSQFTCGEESCREDICLEVLKGRLRDPRRNPVNASCYYGLSCEVLCVLSHTVHLQRCVPTRYCSLCEEKLKSRTGMKQ